MGQNSVINSWRSADTSDYGNLGKVEKNKSTTSTLSFDNLLNTKLQSETEFKQPTKRNVEKNNTLIKSQRLAKPKALTAESASSKSESAKPAERGNKEIGEDNASLKKASKMDSSSESTSPKEVEAVQNEMGESDKVDSKPSEELIQNLEKMNEQLYQLLQSITALKENDGDVPKALTEGVAALEKLLNESKLVTLELKQENSLDQVQTNQLLSQLNTLKGELTVAMNQLKAAMSLKEVSGLDVGKKIETTMEAISDLSQKLLSKTTKGTEKISSFEKKLQEVMSSNTTATESEQTPKVGEETKTNPKVATGDVKNKVMAESAEDRGTHKNNEMPQKLAPTKVGTEQKVSSHLNVPETVAKMDASSIAFSKNEVNTLGKTSLQQSILDQIVNSPRLQVRQTEQGTLMTLKLNPEVLGNVEIKMEIVKNVFKAEIQVENMIVKGAIESNLADLKQALSEKGYQVDLVEVSVNDQGASQQQNQQRQSKDEGPFHYMSQLEEESDSEVVSMNSDLTSEGNINYLG